MLHKCIITRLKDFEAVDHLLFGGPDCALRVVYCALCMVHCVLVQCLSCKMEAEEAMEAVRNRLRIPL